MRDGTWTWRMPNFWSKVQRPGATASAGAIAAIFASAVAISGWRSAAATAPPPMPAGLKDRGTLSLSHTCVAPSPYSLSNHSWKLMRLVASMPHAI